MQTQTMPSEIVPLYSPFTSGLPGIQVDLEYKKNACISRNVY
jgi:hypothetical protein